jgi:hypothetical protein
LNQSPDGQEGHAPTNPLWRITQHSTIDHDNIQLGGGPSPMYLAKYFFPLVLLFLSLLYVS